MSDAIEVQLKSIVTRSTVSRGTETTMVLLIQPNEVHKIEPLRDLLNHRFGMALAGPIANDESQPAQEEKSGESYKGTKPPAAPNRSPGALTGYGLGAVTRCRDFEFQSFLADDFPNEPGTDALQQLVDFRLMRPDSFDTDTGIREGFAKKIILGLMGDIQSRKEIIEGSDAGNRWEILMDRFSRWKERKAADQSRNG